jgi:hypothetical protein
LSRPWGESSQNIKTSARPPAGNTGVSMEAAKRVQAKRFIT